MRGRIVADPALVHRLAGQLVARIRRQPDSVGLVVRAGVQQVHAKDQQIPQLVLCRQPAARQLLAHRNGIVGVGPRRIPANLAAFLARQLAALAPGRSDETFRLGAFVRAEHIDIGLPITRL